METHLIVIYFLNFFFLLFSLTYRIVTNFALLLQGNGSKNGDEPVDLTFSYISLAFIIAAIIICLVSSIVYDIRKRYLSYSSDRSLKESFARHESRSKGNSQSGTYINV